MIRKFSLDGEEAEALVLNGHSIPFRTAAAKYGDGPCVLMPDDGELAPALSVIGTAYTLYSDATARARARVLGDRARAEKRAALTERLLAHIHLIAEDVAGLCALDGVREGLRSLKELPETLRPAGQASNGRRCNPKSGPDAQEAVAA